MKPSEWIELRTHELTIEWSRDRPGTTHVPTRAHFRTLAIAEWLDRNFGIPQPTPHLTPELLEAEIEKRDTEPRPPAFPSVMVSDVDDEAHAETELHVTGPEASLGAPGANGPSEAE